MTRNKTQTIVWLITLISCKQTEPIEDEELKKDYLFDFGVYVEKVSPYDNCPDRYTTDNEIYTNNKTFVFDYYILRKGDTLKMATKMSVSPEGNRLQTWDLIPANENNRNKIETISIAVQSGISNGQQTEVKYTYQCSAYAGFEPLPLPFSSTSGIIENKLNVWMHPHRDQYFMILELNPFPYIQKPFETGTKWTWNLEIGDNWGDERWKTWNGSIRNDYEYEIIGNEKITTALGTMDCWVIQGTAISELGATGLIAYFNEKNGFIKLDYINIDKSLLKIEIKEIR